MENEYDVAAEMSGLFYHITCLSKYSEEEIGAMHHEIAMTEEIFEKCIKTAMSLCDFENIKNLKKEYPEFADK